MKNKILLFVAMTFAAVTLSCKRQVLLTECPCSETVAIPVSIDWSKSGVTPKNVSMLFYNKSDGSLAKEFTFEHSDNDIQAYVTLPVGEYKVVVFNELRDQIDYVNVSDHENISTLKFYATSDDNAKSRSESANYVQQPGDLATAIVDNVIVDEDLIIYAASGSSTKSDVKSSVDQLQSIVTEKKTTWLDITVHLTGLNNVLLTLVDLGNVADGYMAESDKNSSSSATMQFDMNNRSYDDESVTTNREGTLSTSVALFGALGDRFSADEHTDQTPIMLDMLFLLVDEKTLETRSKDITDLIEFTPQTDGSVKMSVYLDFDDEPFENVEPAGSTGGSGFGSDVDDWYSVDVPLTSN